MKSRREYDIVLSEDYIVIWFIEGLKFKSL